MDTSDSNKGWDAPTQVGQRQWLSPAEIAMIDADAYHSAHQIRQAAAQGAPFSIELAQELEEAARLIRVNNGDPLADFS